MDTRSDAEISLSNIESTLFVNKRALESARGSLRQLQQFTIWPETQSESILFSGVDIGKEIQRVTDHILHLMERIEFSATLMFQHKLVHGEDE
jgi:hypothetical protein